MNIFWTIITVIGNGFALILSFLTIAFALFGGKWQIGTFFTWRPYPLLRKSKRRYTVKQEQLYYVDFMSGDIHKRLIRDPENGVFDIIEWSRNLIGVVDEMFTESEIKAIDERYWLFKEEVEEEQQ